MVADFLCYAIIFWNEYLTSVKYPSWQTLMLQKSAGQRLLVQKIKYRQKEKTKWLAKGQNTHCVSSWPSAVVLPGGEFWKTRKAICERVISCLFICVSLST
jgi:hypothetical protein